MQNPELGEKRLEEVKEGIGEEEGEAECTVLSVGTLALLWHMEFYPIIKIFWQHNSFSMLHTQ